MSTVINFKKILAKLMNTPMIVERGTCAAFDFNSLYDTTIYEEPDGSKWLRIFHHSNPASNLFSSSDDFSKGIKKNDNAWYNIENVCTSMNYFEFMVKQKDTAESTENKYRWVQNANPIGATWAQVQPNNVTRITTDGYTSNSAGGLYVWANTNTGTNNARMSIANGTAANWFGAAGSWTPYNSGIPGFPDHTVTTGYMDIYIRYEPDYISKWTYCKWSDGTAECWYNNEFSIPKMSLEGSVFWYNSPIYQYPTNLFMKPPIVNISCGCGNSTLLWSSLRENSNTTLKWYYVGDTNGARPSVLYNIHAIGNWAEINPDTQSLLISSYSQKQMTKAEIQGLIEASGNQFKDNDTWIPSDLT